jgi:hypothetical protein
MEMDSGAACMFIVCMNWTRDGKNRENEICEERWQEMVRMLIMLREKMLSTRMVREPQQWWKFPT